MEGKLQAMLMCFMFGLMSFAALWTFGDYYLDLATSLKRGMGNYIALTFLCSCFGPSALAPVFQGEMLGVQNFLARIIGAGALAPLFRLLTKASFERSENDLRKWALLSFVISTLFQFLSIITFAIHFPVVAIVKHSPSKATFKGSKIDSANLVAAGIQNETSQEVGFDAIKQERLSNKQVFLQNMDYAADLVLIYMVTLSIMLGFLYEDIGSHKLETWCQLVLITMYNICDIISTWIPGIKCLKLESRKGLFIATILRFLLIPGFYFTTEHGDQGWMIMLVSLLGLTNGYLSVCVCTRAPIGYKVLQGPQQNALGNLFSFSIFGGICAGVAFHVYLLFSQ